MLKPERLAAKLLLSGALVAVSVFYGWWQRQSAARLTAPQVRTARRVAPPPHPAPTTPLTVAPAAPEAADSVSTPAPAPAQPRSATTTAIREARIPRALPKPVAAPPETAPPPAAAPPAPLSAEAALEMYLPTEGPSPPFPIVTGTPAQGAAVALPAGTHLADGDYVSDRHQFEWGDLKVKLSIHGGEIVAVQVLQYPDHRSQSLYLSQLAAPALAGEVIKSQAAQVDIVSSATDTSYAFQDTVANAIMKATRGS